MCGDFLPKFFVDTETQPYYQCYLFMLTNIVYLLYATHYYKGFTVVTHVIVLMTTVEVDVH